MKEFQVNSNSFSAEYGRAGGAVINVVTKSGTNELHGSVFEFYRDKALNANNAINELNNRPKSPYHYNQFGGTLGGPIRRNRDFYFVNYDGQRNTQPNVVFLNLPATRPADAGDAGRRSRGCSRWPTSWERTLDQDVFLVKTDHELNAANRLTLRYNHQNFTGEGFENGGAQNALEHTGASLVKTRTFNAALDQRLGPTLFNELRFQYARDQRAGRGQLARTPKAVVQQSGDDGADDRPQQLQPARDDDQALADRRHGDAGSAARTSSRPASISSSTTSSTASPGSSAARTRSAAWRRSPAAGRTAPTSSTSRTSPAPDTTGAGDAPEHPRVLVLRAGRVEAARAT